MNGGITPIASPGDRTLDHQLTRRNEELATREKKTASRIVYWMPQYMYIIDVLSEKVTPFTQECQHSRAQASKHFKRNRLEQIITIERIAFRLLVSLLICGH